MDVYGRPRAPILPELYYALPVNRGHHLTLAMLENMQTRTELETRKAGKRGFLSETVSG
jgi:hypothetical protein